MPDFVGVFFALEINNLTLKETLNRKVHYAMECLMVEIYVLC